MIAEAKKIISEGEEEVEILMSHMRLIPANLLEDRNRSFEIES